MKVLITGVAGFIGSHLVDCFIEKGHTVIGVDSFLTGRPENIEHFSKEKFKFIKADVTCENFDPEEDIDGVLHLASPASPLDFKKLPLEIMDANSVGTKRCLEVARKYSARFLMASTSEVYGDPLVHPQVESYLGNVNPCGVRSVYDESKRFSEALTYAYKRKYGLEVRVARIFNTYGPRMRIDDGRVVPAFIDGALNGRALTVFGDGKQTRSFCYVSDEVEGIYRLFNSDYSGPVNIGNPDEFTIIELAKVLGDIIGRKLKLKFLPLPEDDPVRRRPDITLARKVLGWEPKVLLAEGLKYTYEWYKNRR